MGSVLLTNTDLEPKTFCERLDPRLQKENIERLRYFDMKCSTTFQKTAKRSYEDPLKTRGLARSTVRKKVQICFFVSESRLLYLKQLFIMTA